jgi:hypothetical protein
MQLKDDNVLAARMRSEVGRASCHAGVAGSLVIPKEFERSNLAFELKAGKKRLELVLHGLTDEQCRMAGAVRSDSISELVSHLIKNEFLSLNGAYERLSGSDKQYSGVEWQTRFVDRRRHSEPRSIQSLLAEFEVVRSAIIYLVEQDGGENAHYDTLAEICVARFNKHIEQIEWWRDCQLVGFSATRLRAEALEPELNAAILEIDREDFLLGNFDLQSLFSESLNRYYSDEAVLWLGGELTNGKQAAFQRLADVLEPVHTVLEMGLGCVDVFRVVSSFQDSQGDFISEWEAVLGGPYSTGAVIRWRTVRVWKQRVVIAERIEGLASVEHLQNGP